MNIVWDFDGIIFPLVPYSSDHILIDYMFQKDFFSFTEKMLMRLAYSFEKKDMASLRFKKCLRTLVCKKPYAVLDYVLEIISAGIPDENVHLLSGLHDAGYKMHIISTGTENIIKNALVSKGADQYFKTVSGNRIVAEIGRIIGYDCLITAESKVDFAERQLGLRSQDTIAVGFGYSDIPILDWARYPVLIDPSKAGWEKFGDRNYIFLESVDMLPRILKSLIVQV